MGREDVIIALPADRSTVPSVKRVRSGLLCSSIQALRARNRFDDYLAHLPREYHDRILALTATEWIDPELAFIHYEALDAVNLPDEQIEENGHRVAQQLQRGFVSVALRLAIESGVTPWTVLERSQKFWERYFDGSRIGAWKVGPKDARVEFVGFPLARIRYIRIGVGGIMRGMVDLVATRSYVRVIPGLCTADTLGYRLSWA